MTKLAAVTPFGTFTRNSKVAFQFVGVVKLTWVKGTENGSRKAGDVEYGANWSRTAAGAEKLATQYLGLMGDGERLYEFAGVFPVAAEAR